MFFDKIKDEILKGVSEEILMGAMCSAIKQGDLRSAQDFLEELESRYEAWEMSL